MNKIIKAAQFADCQHAGQCRKYTGAPYITHCTRVAIRVMMLPDATEEMVCAAWMHDTVEDCGGAERLRDIRERFGDDVATIVDGCTDTYETPKPPWLERKRRYIEHLKDSDSSTRLVSASDKLHNTRAILAELRRTGLEVFERFAGKKDGTLWYYRTLVTGFRHHGDHADLIDELDRVVSEIERLSDA